MHRMHMHMHTQPTWPHINAGVIHPTSIRTCHVHARTRACTASQVTRARNMVMAISGTWHAPGVPARWLCFRGHAAARNRQRCWSRTHTPSFGVATVRTSCPAPASVNVSSCCTPVPSSGSMCNSAAGIVRTLLPMPFCSLGAWSLPAAASAHKGAEILKAQQPTSH